jgi:hypothetical protein
LGQSVLKTDVDGTNHHDSTIKPVEFVSQIYFVALPHHFSYQFKAKEGEEGEI